MATKGLAPLLALCAFGCGDPDRTPEMSRRVVPVAEVPEAVVKAARKTVPGVDFNEAWKNLDRQGKLHSYEIRGRAANGKIREARGAADGTILEVE